jgi:hypothetical protein
MGTMGIFNSFLPVMLLFVICLAIYYFYKSPWFKRAAGKAQVHYAANIHLNKNKNNVLQDATRPTADGIPHIDHTTIFKFPECRATAAMPFKDGAIDMGSDADPVFTDSGGNRMWRDEDIQAAFTDGAFR